MSWAVGVGLGGAHQGQLGHVRATEGDQPARSEGERQLVVGGRPPLRVAQRPHALVVRLAGLLAADVLEQERHAAERTVGEWAAGFPPGALELPMDHAVQLRIERLDSRHRGVDELDRLDVAAANQLRQACRVVIPEDVAHHRHRSGATP